MRKLMAVVKMLGLAGTLALPEAGMGAVVPGTLPSTSWTRTWLRSTNAEQARSTLGITTTNASLATTNPTFYGHALVESNLTVGGGVTVTGALTVAGAMTITGGDTSTFSNVVVNGTLTATNAALLTSLAWTNVESYGVKHDGRMVWGTLVSGSADVEVTSGSVSASDEGRYIRVRLGGGASNDLVTTIASVAGAVLTLNKACTNDLALAELVIAETDDATAFQAAIDDVQTKGGGTIMCPPGIYWLGTNLTFAAVSASPALVPTIAIVGAIPPQLNVAAAEAGGAAPAGTTVFMSGQEQGNPGAAGAGNTNALFIHRRTTGAHPGLILENLLFRAPTDPRAPSVDCRGFHSLIARRCVWDTGGWGEHDSRIPRPTCTNSIALINPSTGNFGGALNRVEGCLICGGFYHGFVFAEHTLVEKLAICNCENALSPNTAIHAYLNELAIEGCVNAINGELDDVGSTLVIPIMHYENQVDGWWHSRTLVRDSRHYLNGSIAIDHLSTFGTGGITNVGGNNLTITYYEAGNNAKDVVNKGHFSAGNWKTPSSPNWANFAEFISQKTNTGFAFKAPSDTDIDRILLVVTPYSSWVTPGNLSFAIRADKTLGGVWFHNMFGDGGVGGVPFYFYPYTYPTLPAMTIHTNGDVGVKGSLYVTNDVRTTDDVFVGDGLDVTGVSVIRNYLNLATAGSHIGWAGASVDGRILMYNSPTYPAYALGIGGPYLGEPGRGIYFFKSGVAPSSICPAIFAQTNVTPDLTVTAANTNGLCDLKVNGAVLIYTNATTCPTPVATGGWLWNSNSALYWVTVTKTNLITDGL